MFSCVRPSHDMCARTRTRAQLRGNIGVHADCGPPPDIDLDFLQSFKSRVSTVKSFSVKACSHSSQLLLFFCGVLQGSVHGPLLFILYSSVSQTVVRGTLGVREALTGGPRENMEIIVFL